MLKGADRQRGMAAACAIRALLDEREVVHIEAAVQQGYPWDMIAWYRRMHAPGRA